VARVVRVQQAQAHDVQDEQQRRHLDRPVGRQPRILGGRGEVERSRDRLTQGLRREGFAVLPSEGTYFLNIDLPGSGIHEGDRDFCLRAVKEADDLGRFLAVLGSVAGRRLTWK